MLPRFWWFIHVFDVFCLFARCIHIVNSIFCVRCLWQTDFVSHFHIDPLLLLTLFFRVCVSSVDRAFHSASKFYSEIYIKCIYTLLPSIAAGYMICGAGIWSFSVRASRNAVISRIEHTQSPHPRTNGEVETTWTAHIAYVRFPVNLFQFMHNFSFHHDHFPAIKQIAINP